MRISFSGVKFEREIKLASSDLKTKLFKIIELTRIDLSA